MGERESLLMCKPELLIRFRIYTIRISTEREMPLNGCQSSALIFIVIRQIELIQVGI